MGDLVIRYQSDDPSIGWVGAVLSCRRSELLSMYPDGYAYEVLFLGPAKEARVRVSESEWFGRGVKGNDLSAKFMRALGGRRRGYWERKLIHTLLAGPIRKTW